MRESRVQDEGRARPWALWALLVLAGGSALGQADGLAPPRYGQVVTPDGSTLHVELAETPEGRRAGYMFRDAVGPEDGMLFLFEGEDFHSFWMKNTRMPLDILWMSAAGRIVDVSPDTPPCVEDPCEHYLPMARARYVLELAGGRAARIGLSVGDELQLLLPEEVAP